MIIGSRQSLNVQYDEIDIEIDGGVISWRVGHTKSLGGITMGDRLSWSKHIDELSRKVSSAIGALKRIRPFISSNTAIQIYNALILPHFDYWSPVWGGLSGQLSDKLPKLQNRTARVITKLLLETSSNLLLNKLKWENLSLRRQKQKALVMYKTMHKLDQEYLQRLFTQRYTNKICIQKWTGQTCSAQAAY